MMTVCFFVLIFPFPHSVLPLTACAYVYNTTFYRYFASSFLSYNSHMHDSKQRRRDLTKRTLTYLTMTLSVLFLVVVCVFIILGYSVDGGGQPEQGGLLQFRSFPTGATVSIDGAKQNFTTNGKKNASFGHHSVNMSLAKYRDWTKNFDLGRGELLWLNALLVPERITTSEIQPFDNLSNIKVSPDKKWIAVVEKPFEAKLKLIDIRDEKNPKTTELLIPETIAKSTGPSDVFKIVEWDLGSRYILVAHTTGDKTEWLRLDRSDSANGRNISTLKNSTISDAHFIGTSGNLFYTLSAGLIHKIDLGSTDAPKVIAENVRSFQLYKDDRIAYISALPSQQSVNYYNGTQSKAYLVKNFKPDQTNVQSAVSSYFNDDYQAVSYGTTIEVVKNPLSGNQQVVAKFNQASGVQWLYFSNNGRFVVAQNGSNLSVYDLERKQNFVFTIPSNPQYTLDHHLKWLDDFHFISDVGGILTLFEFDGDNIETIGNVTQGYDITLSDNGKRLFYIGTNSVTGKLALQSSVMVVE